MAAIFDFFEKEEKVNQFFPENLDKQLQAACLILA